ncbi:MAG TPA: hydroxyisourate hydrolase [Allosphingosinicella sp.]
MSTLSTHVLDTMHGRPAARLALVLSGPDGEIARGTTNSDGRCPDLAPGTLAPGQYAIRFAVADYFRGLGVALPDPPFLDEVTVAFGVAAEGRHYHVPLLVSPFAYSTYRGS